MISLALLTLYSQQKVDYNFCFYLIFQLNYIPLRFITSLKLKGHPGSNYNQQSIIVA